MANAFFQSEKRPFLSWKYNNKGRVQWTLPLLSDGFFE